MNVLHTDRYSHTNFYLDEGEPLKGSDLLKAHLRTPLSVLHLRAIHPRNIKESGKLCFFLNRNGVGFAAGSKHKAIQMQKEFKYFLKMWGKKDPHQLPFPDYSF